MMVSKVSSPRDLLGQKYQNSSNMRAEMVIKERKTTQTSLICYFAYILSYQALALLAITSEDLS